MMLTTIITSTHHVTHQTLATTMDSAAHEDLHQHLVCASDDSQ